MNNDILTRIYTFDNTFREKYNIVIEEIYDKISDKKLKGIEKHFDSLFTKISERNYKNDYNNKCYLVLDHKEVSELIIKAIKDYLYTFSAEFLQPRLKIKLTRDAINLILDLGFSSNVVIEQLLIDFDRFAEEAITEYGIGDFLAIDGIQDYVALDKNIAYYIYLVNY